MCFSKCIKIFSAIYGRFGLFVFQKGNPALKAVSNIPWEYDENILSDYVMGPSTCALFLSIRYHNLNPDYIHDRLKVLGNKYELRVLLVQVNNVGLCLNSLKRKKDRLLLFGVYFQFIVFWGLLFAIQVDTPDPHHALKHLTRICILANLTLVLAWSAEEAGRILETYKIFEHKPPDLIMERKESDPHSKVNLISKLLKHFLAASILSIIYICSLWMPWLQYVLWTKLMLEHCCPRLGPWSA